jgi:hypothetical protein
LRRHRADGRERRAVHDAVQRHCGIPVLRGHTLVVCSRSYIRRRVPGVQKRPFECTVRVASPRRPHSIAAGRSTGGALHDRAHAHTHARTRGKHACEHVRRFPTTKHKHGDAVYEQRRRCVRAAHLRIQWSRPAVSHTSIGL